jgi:hypothetical protein
MAKHAFVFSTDPGHGWLLVAPAELADVGLTEADISSYSYRSPDGGLLALEEDCDAATFIEAWKAKNPGEEISIRESFSERNPIRNWPDFGTKVFSYA